MKGEITKQVKTELEFEDSFIIRNWTSLLKRTRKILFSTCWSKSRFCRSHSSRTHCWHINDVHGIYSQVRKGYGVRRVVDSRKLEITFSWVVSNVVSNRLSSEILLWHASPFHHQTSGTCFERANQVRSSRWSCKHIQGQPKKQTIYAIFLIGN